MVKHTGTSFYDRRRGLELCEQQARYYANSRGLRVDWRELVTDAWLGLVDAESRVDDAIPGSHWFVVRRIGGAIRDGLRRDRGRHSDGAFSGYVVGKYRDDNDMRLRSLESGEEAEAAMGWLPPTHRAVARLSAIGLPVEEIAHVCGVTDRAIYKRKRQMRERFS